MGGGCSSGSLPDNCTEGSTAAYWDKCPDTGEFIHPANDCPSLKQGDCTSEHPAELCYWRGPAYDSDARPTKYFPDAEPNLNGGASDGLRKMVKQRIASQHEGQNIKDKPEWPTFEYWNEVTIDGKVLDYVLRSSPQAAVAGIMYFKGDKDAHTWARQYNDALKKTWNFEVPIIAMNVAEDMREKGGPFSVEETFPALEKETLSHPFSAFEEEDDLRTVV